ncbi:2-succinyl-5-enolpyruvyl-6-hydroxy-3-cyclohexene-1-carboxylic-acid synthase [Aeromicrobium sp. PE09-221]|uniref:2-succinyl-5-enolpyruvyl-6-hydroxy-3- cyclohexene-1-carboxylic-acid synthase n=1 Tax=Aeromicrobium sp. PE09-221 TaxID=1898043 RepID=UPI000B3E6D72|nr:2-succinyl-5-enolpyruvyl-6-hydroxy-3-cyclohexene-1-carboxylic-acid synthase [Aeromicrobium sp. PE09-221]OUZ07851.1 2-succinyl-5-enolpyruvyl-6-hydroxy-3-cyclohexene-1-carboxylic-acid synthase [Aeromicrobium sp. PE09-221]
MTSQRAVGIARDLVDELLARGATEAVLAPGSRSGPLALALHAADQQGLLRLHVRVDEREAGFLALGLAKATGFPVPVVTTSGTAVANLHPALLEAHHARTPVLAVTADRPARLRGTGANQTTDQRRIFPRVGFAESVAELATVWRETGPCHLNLEFDEPLIEVAEWRFAPPGRSAEIPDTAVTMVEPGPRTVVLAGDGAGEGAVLLAERGGWPLLADPSSGSRRGPSAIASYRLLLDHFAERIERVVSFGHATLSRSVTALLSRSDVDIVHVGDQSTFPVPAGERVTFAEAAETVERPADDWLATWQEADRRVRDALPSAEVLEIARTVWSAAADGLLFVGSSNPVRDLDLVADPAHSPVQVFANRGLAGIDGALSTAIGAAFAQRDRKALAVVGDLTFLHGSNGLLIGPAEPRPDLTVVVVSDDGGSIFATLEQGSVEYASAFERVYATPTGARIADLCAGYGIAYERVEPAALSAALEEGAGGVRVLEVPVSRADRRALADACTRSAREALAG